MKVIDLSENDLEIFCSSVAQSIAAGKKNVCIVGVAEGGLPISDMLWNSFLKAEGKHAYLKLKCTRPSTKKKKKNGVKDLLKILFKILPKFLLNRLRILEHKILMSKNTEVERIVDYETWVEKGTGFQEIIIVDDAVDSGNSVKFLKEKFAKEFSDVDVKVAAVVLTNLESIVIPEYTLYENVLVRFPWSMDA